MSSFGSSVSLRVRPTPLQHVRQADTLLSVSFSHDKLQRERTISSFQDLVAYLDEWTASCFHSDPTTWNEIFVDVATTDFYRAVSSRMLVNSQPAPSSPLFCPICRTHVMTPYQRVWCQLVPTGWFQTLNGANWNHDTGTRICQIASNALQWNNNPVDLSLPQNAPGERRRVILFCPIFCCATLYNKSDYKVSTPPTTEADSEGDDNVQSVPDEPTEDDAALVCISFDLILVNEARERILEFSEEALVTEMAEMCEVPTMSIVVNSKELWDRQHALLAVNEPKGVGGDDKNGRSR